MCLEQIEAALSLSAAVAENFSRRSWISNEGNPLNAEEISKMLRRVRQGRLGVEDALEHLRDLPYEDLGYAKIDHHRPLRQGLPVS